MVSFDFLLYLCPHWKLYCVFNGVLEQWDPYLNKTWFICLQNYFYCWHFLPQISRCSGFGLKFLYRSLFVFVVLELIRDLPESLNTRVTICVNKMCFWFNVKQTNKTQGQSQVIKTKRKENVTFKFHREKQWHFPHNLPTQKNYDAAKFYTL